MNSSTREPNPYGIRLKAGWRETTLAELVDHADGFISTGPFGSQLHAHDYKPEGTPVVMPQQLGDNQITLEGIARISDEDRDRLSRHVMEEGDIVFSRRGDVTRRSYIGPREAGWICGTGCLLIRVKHEDCDNRFLSLFFSLPRFKDYITQKAVGATMPNLNQGILGRVPVILPRIDGQRRIVETLSTYDDLIENNRRRMALLEESARHLYQEWFVRLRFPGHEHTSIVDGVPEGWVRITIAELVERGEIELQTGPFGTQLKASDYTEEGAPVINVRNIGFGDVRPEKLEYVPDHVVERLQQHVLKAGDIVFGRKGAVDRHVLIRSSQEGWVQGSDCIRMRSLSPRISTLLFSLAFRESTHKEWMLTQCSNKATMASLNQDVLGRIVTTIPSHSIFQAFVDLAAVNLEQIGVLDRQSHKARTARDLLLPRLMSGEVAV
jgi:type I restriction enzyme S subunit